MIHQVTKEQAAFLDLLEVGKSKQSLECVNFMRNTVADYDCTFRFSYLDHAYLDSIA